MNKSRKGIKRVLAMALAVVMTFSIQDLSLTTAWGSETDNAQSNSTETNRTSDTESTIIYQETVDLGTIETSAYGISLMSDEPYVSLKSGNYADWIDRIDVPDYGKTFYEALVEGADNDGTDDFLIDDAYYASEADNIKMFTYSDNTSETYNVVTAATLTSTADDFDINEAYAVIRAVYDAFDRDHPEVFWLSGATSAGATISYDGITTYTATIYLLLKEQSSESSYDLRAEGYQSESTIEADITARDNAVNAILSGTTATDTVELIKYFNNWLTTHNEYCTTQVSIGNSPDASHECLSALTGSTGETGPVCEGYARAFKVLCGQKGIPCVLVDGTATSNGTSGEAHMWNYVQVDGAWYAVDVTWNDPVVANASGPVSNYESDKWLLLGSDTVVFNDGNDWTFLQSHPVSNMPSNNGVAFINGPVLSTTKYLEASIKLVTVDKTELTYGYTTGAVVTATLSGASAESAAYQWYKKAVTDAATDTIVENATSSTLPTGLDAGIYYCQVKYSGSVKNSADIVVNKAKLTPSITGYTSKAYDGTTKVTDKTSLSITLDGIIDADIVTVSADYTYADGNAGTNIAIYATDIELAGEDAANYYIDEEVVVAANVGTIDKKDISNMTVDLDKTTLTYNGMSQTVNVTVKDGTKELAAGTDYTVSGNTNTAVASYEVTVTGKGNYTGTATKTYSISFLNTEVSVKYNGEESIPAWCNEDVVITADGYTISENLSGAFTDSYTVSKEGTTSDLKLYFKETATGYITDAIKILQINIDKTAPSFEGEEDGISVATNTWKELLNKITFGLLFNETQDVSIKATDGNSGIRSYYYYVDKTGITEVKTAEELELIDSEFKELEAGKTFSLDADGNYVIYAYAIDDAMNRSAYICTNGIVIDQTSPTITNVIEPTVDNGNLKDVSAAYSFTSNEAGTYYIAAVEYAETNTKLTPEEIMAEYESSVMQAGTNTFTVPGLKPNTAYGVYLVVKDNAGNYSDFLKIITTRKTLPVFSSNPVLKGTYGQKVSEMTLICPNSTNGVAGAWEYSNEVDTDEMPQIGTTDSYKVIFIPEDKDVYETVTVDVVPDVAKKDISVTVNNATKTFGTENPEFAVTVPEGALVGTDSVADLKITLSTTATQTSDAGTYAITGKADAANYNVTFTKGTLTITQAEAPKVTPIDKYYIYTTGSEGTVSVDIAEQLPSNRGTTAYSYTSTGDILSDVAVDADGKLSYKVKAGETDATANITVIVASKNYQDITVEVKVTLTDKISVDLKDGETVEVAGGKTLTYGDKLNVLSLTEAEFVTKAGTVVPGTLTWAEPDIILNAGTHLVGWKFVPTDNSKYIDVTGNISVTVGKATANVEAPTAEAVIYDPTEKLADVTLTGANASWTVGGKENEVKGTWAWKDTTIVPTVGNTGYTAVFTPADTANFNTVEKTVTVEVAKATPVISELPTASDITYGKTLADSELTGGKAVYAEGSDFVVTGNFTWKDTTIAPTVADSQKTTYEIIFAPTDTANYNIVTMTITLVVEKAEWPSNTPESNIEAVYYVEKISDIELPENWGWADEDKDKGINIGVKTEVTAIYQGTDADNFANTSKVIKVTREINAPYIEGDESAMGWAAIQGEIKNSQNLEIKVDMNGFTYISGDTLKVLKEEGKTIVFIFENGITWTIEGSDIDETKLNKYMDMGVILFEKGASDRPEIPESLLNEVLLNEKTHKFLSLFHDGEFGFRGTLSINIGKDHAGRLATLYYYNEETGKLEKTENVKLPVDADGRLEFTFTHASDYVIVLEEKPSEDQLDNDTKPGISSDNENTAGTTGNTSGNASANTGDNRFGYAVLFAVLFLMGAIAVQMGARKKIKK